MPVSLKLSTRLLSVALVVALSGLIGMVVEGVWIYARYREAQAILDNTTALVAANGIDTARYTETGVAELRLSTDASRPSAYELAQGYMATQSANLHLTMLVCDGEQVIARGTFSTPTMFLRVAGLATLNLDLISTAAVAAP